MSFPADVLGLGQCHASIWSFFFFASALCSELDQQSEPCSELKERLYPLHWATLWIEQTTLFFIVVLTNDVSMLLLTS